MSSPRKTTRAHRLYVGSLRARLRYEEARGRFLTREIAHLTRQFHEVAAQKHDLDACCDELCRLLIHLHSYPLPRAHWEVICEMVSRLSQKQKKRIQQLDELADYIETQTEDSDDQKMGE